MVKDAILHDNIEDFPITRRLLNRCRASLQKFIMHLDLEKQREDSLQKEEKIQTET